MAASATPSPRVALVLAGGAARGAYEVGVIQHVLTEVARDLGRPVPLQILCGTSVGAINVCALAAFAGEPRLQVQRLLHHWTRLQIHDLLRPSVREIVSMTRSALGRPGTSKRRGGIFHPAGLQQLLSSSIPFSRIEHHIRSGRLTALTVSTTQVATGRTVVFVQGGRARLPRDPMVEYKQGPIRIEHALASAAIPILFPAVRIHGELYCDGGLRQNVPLSPARRLGAERLLVVNPHFFTPTPAAPAIRDEAAVIDPLFIIGKALNALLLDRIDNDIERLHRITEILEAGERRYGPDFVAELNLAMGRGPGQELRGVKAVLIRASQDIGRLSSEFVRSARFAGRARGVLGRLIRHIADHEALEADFLSYLLFDGEFARCLIDLGREDARAHHTALCQLFSDPR